MFYIVEDILHDVLFFSFLRRQVEKVINNNIYATECYFIIGRGIK